VLGLHHDKDPEEEYSFKIAFGGNEEDFTWPRITTLTSSRGVNRDQEYTLTT